MLKIIVPAVDMYDSANERFITTEETELELEHSLFSISKWEAKWEIPFLVNEKRTDAQTIDYVRSMILQDDVPDEVINRLTQENYSAITDYIDKKMTATWFSDKQTPGVKEVVTSEIIYYMMVSLRIPFETQHWHLNRLLALIKVINLKNAPAKKMSRSEMAQRNRDLNRQRMAAMGTRG